MNLFSLFARTFGKKVRSLGYILLFVGALPLGQTIYHQVYGVRAQAEVIGTDTVCRARRCKECRQRRIDCAQAQATRHMLYSISKTQYATVFYSTREGRTRSARASFSMLNLKRAAPGDRLPILYMQHNPKRIAGPAISVLVYIGAGLMALGLVLLFAMAGTTRQFRAERAAAREAARRAPPSKSEVQFARLKTDIGGALGSTWSRAGWFLLIAGMIPFAITMLDQVTGERAVAEVARVYEVCRLKPSRQRIRCPRPGSRLDAQGKVKRKQYFILTVYRPDGSRARARASLSKLQRRTATVGERFKVLYRPFDNYVAPRQAGSWVGTTGLISFVGFLMLMLRAMLRSTGAGASTERDEVAQQEGAPAPVTPTAPAPVRTPTRTSTATWDGERNRREPALARTSRTPVSRPYKRPSRQPVLSRTSSGPIQTGGGVLSWLTELFAARPEKQPRRRSAVQRNRSWI